jgi:hypothetical protein
MLRNENCSVAQLKENLLCRAECHGLIFILTEIEITRAGYGAKLLLKVRPVTHPLITAANIQKVFVEV